MVGCAAPVPRVMRQSLGELGPFHQYLREGVGLVETFGVTCLTGLLGAGAIRVHVCL